MCACVRVRAWAHAWCGGGEEEKGRVCLGESCELEVDPQTPRKGHISPEPM